MGKTEGQKKEALENPVFLTSESYTRPEDPAQEPTFLGNRCPSCERVFFPARALCPDCFGEEPLDPAQLSGRGVIYASTVVRIPAPVGIPAPYAYGYVDLDGSGIRIFALFSGAEPEWFQPGRVVRAMVDTIRRDEQGREVIGYKFGPLEEGTTHE